MPHPTSNLTSSASSPSIPPPTPSPLSTAEPILLPSPPPPTTISTLLTLIAQAFTKASDPLEIYFLRTESPSSSSSPVTLTLPIVLDFITPNITRSLTTEGCEAWIVPSPSPSTPTSSIEATLLLYPPTNPRPPRPITSTTPPAIATYGTQSEAIKQRILAPYKARGLGWYYIYIVARNPDVPKSSSSPSLPTPDAASTPAKAIATGGGAITRLMRDVVLSRAQQEGLPVYLEATSEHSKTVYEWFGFRVVGEIVLPPVANGRGQGQSGGKGKVEGEGEGVTVWCMLWTPVGFE